MKFAASSIQRLSLSERTVPKNRALLTEIEVITKRVAHELSTKRKTPKPKPKHYDASKVAKRHTPQEIRVQQTGKL